MTNDRQTDAKPARAKTNPWTVYWEHGFLTSCADTFDVNYQGKMREVWERFMEPLENDAKILDICTGNGAIAVIAADVSRRLSKNFEIHGIDRAHVHPADTLKSGPDLVENIEFHSETPAEDTSFDDAYFDAVTGQYALEYTHIPDTARELHRIMATGSRGLFVMHHGDSVVLETTGEELRHGELLFESTGLFDHAKSLLLRMAKATTTQARRALANDGQRLTVWNR